MKLYKSYWKKEIKGWGWGGGGKEGEEGNQPRGGIIMAGSKNNGDDS